MVGARLKGAVLGEQGGLHPATEATSDRSSAKGRTAAGGGHSPGASGSASSPAGHAARSARGTGSQRCPPCGAASPRSPARTRRDAGEPPACPGPAAALKGRSTPGEAGRWSPGEGALHTERGQDAQQGNTGEQAAPEDRRGTRRWGAGRAAGRLRARWSGGRSPESATYSSPLGLLGRGPRWSQDRPGCGEQRPHLPGTTSWPRWWAGLTLGSRCHCPLLGTCMPPTPTSHGRRAGHSRAPP